MSSFLPRLDPRELASRVNRIAGSFTIMASECQGACLERQEHFVLLFAQQKLKGSFACGLAESRIHPRGKLAGVWSSGCDGELVWRDRSTSCFFSPSTSSKVPLRVVWCLNPILL